MSDTPAADYSIGHESAFLGYLRYRSAESCAGFLRPRIEEDSEILDCGCGPGSITVGLAQWAPKGTTVGLDYNGDQLENARAAAKSLGIGNVSFQQGSIFELPFEDDRFDVVYINAVLIHIPNHAQAIAEMGRVLKPGGTIALRDIINELVPLWPNGRLAQVMRRIYRQGMLSTGGDPDVGRILGQLLVDGGFEEVVLSLDWEQPPNNAHRADYFARLADTVGTGVLGTRAVEQGWCSAAERDEVAAYWRDLAGNPAALFGLPFVQAMGRKRASA